MSTEFCISINDEGKAYQIRVGSVSTAVNPAVALAELDFQPDKHPQGSHPHDMRSYPCIYHGRLCWCSSCEKPEKTVT